MMISVRTIAVGARHPRSVGGRRGPAKRALSWVASVGLLAALMGAPNIGYAEPDTASSVSQYGITWVFSGESRVGRYVSGDWWVVGPVTITEIQPESTVVDGRVMHGAMVNPVGGTQGYDSYDSDMGYDPDLNVDPGATGRDLTVQEGSIVAAISKDSPNNPGRPVLDDLAILTVVQEPPAPDAFRPGPYSEGKTSRWSASDLDYGVLRSLPMLSTAPDLDRVTRSVKRFWNEQDTNWTQRAVHASNNQPTYGREIAYTFGDALLSLHLDYSNQEKRDLFVNVVQRGIDIFDRASVGGVWEDLGGHNYGRKMPMLFAGLALDAPSIISMADASENLIFQEDRQTFIVSEDDVGRELRTDDRDRETYREEDVGMPEWGAQHTRNERRDDRRWGAQYRWVGSGFMHHALAAHVMESGTELGESATADWNHTPFFEYVDRYERLGSPSSSNRNEIQPFAQEFWDEYRYVGPGGSGGSRPSQPEFER